MNAHKINFYSRWFLLSYFLLFIVGWAAVMTVLRLNSNVSIQNCPHHPDDNNLTATVSVFIQNLKKQLTAEVGTTHHHNYIHLDLIPNHLRKEIHLTANYNPRKYGEIDLIVSWSGQALKVHFTVVNHIGMQGLNFGLSWIHQSGVVISSKRGSIVIKRRRSLLPSTNTQQIKALFYETLRIQVQIDALHRYKYPAAVSTGGNVNVIVYDLVPDKNLIYRCQRNNNPVISGTGDSVQPQGEVDLDVTLNGQTSKVHFIVLDKKDMKLPISLGVPWIIQQSAMKIYPEGNHLVVN